MSSKSSLLLRRVAPLAALAVGCAVVVVLILSSMSSRPATAEALFRELQRINAAGELGQWWDLLTDDARADFTTTLERDRVTYRKNAQHKENESIWRKYSVSLSEFYSLSARDMFIRELSPPDRRMWMVDAKILDIGPAMSGNPDEEMIRWRRTDGRIFNLLVRDSDAGYGIVRQWDGGWEGPRRQ